MDTDMSQLDPEQMRRNLAITLGAQQPQLAALRAPAGPEMAAPGPINLPGQDRVPNLAISAPAVSSLGGKKTGTWAPQGTIPGDKQERARQISTGAGVDQIYGKITGSDFGQDHPIAGKALGGLAQGIGKLGDIGLSAVAPALAINLPGTEFHHAAQLHGLNRQIGDEEGEAKNEATTASEQAEIPLKSAQTQEANARAEALAHPEDKPDKFTFQQTDHGLMRIDAVTGEATPVTYQGQPLQPREKEMPPKGMEHVPVLGPDGKPVLANFHPDTGKYTDTSGNEIPNARPVPPPPNYGQLVLPTKTSTYIDPKTGVPTEFQWNAQTQRYDIPVGQSATGGYGHEAAQAGAVERAGNALIQDIEANRASLGTLGAWVSKYGLNTPIADPKLAGLQAKMASFAALNPAMHGARGLHAMEHFERLIGGLQQNPDASIEGIRGIIQTAHEINPGVANEAPSGASDEVYAKDGKTLIGHVVNGKYVALGGK